MQRRVALTGAIGSGKTTVARELTEGISRDRAAILSFADGVRWEVAEAAATEDLPVGEIIWEMCHTEHKRRWRTALQVWGTEVRRQIFGEDYWVERMRGRMELYDLDFVVVVDDMRFKNEADMLREEGFFLVRLAPNPDYEAAETVHASEAEWASMSVDLEVPWGDLAGRVNIILGEWGEWV